MAEAPTIITYLYNRIHVLYFKNIIKKIRLLALTFECHGRGSNTSIRVIDALMLLLLGGLRPYNPNNTSGNLLTLRHRIGRGQLLLHILTGLVKRGPPPSAPPRPAPSGPCAKLNPLRFPNPPALMATVGLPPCRGIPGH